MARFLRLVRCFIQVRSKTVGKPQVDHGDGQHQQLRCSPNLPGHHTQYPGGGEHGGYDADDSRWQIVGRFSPCDELRGANPEGQVFSRGG